MTIIVLTDCPPKLRGDLTKWLIEINTGVYVGRVNPRVREGLWRRVIENLKHGRATMVYRSNNEQHMEFRVHNTTWQPVDFEGITLMRRPTPPTEITSPAKKALQTGFSKAAHQQMIRRMQHKSSNVKVRDYIVVDIETTGLDALRDNIIEIAALRVENNQIVADFHRYIRIDGTIPANISDLTGITDQILLDKGIPLRQAIQDLISFIEDDLLVCHNAPFDHAFLLHACKLCKLPPLENRLSDTMKLARRKLDNAPDFHLASLAKLLNIPHEKMHNAKTDCAVTQVLFEKLNEM